MGWKVITLWYHRLVLMGIFVVVVVLSAYDCNGFLTDFTEFHLWNLMVQNLSLNIKAQEVEFIFCF